MARTFFYALMLALSVGSARAETWTIENIGSGNLGGTTDGLNFNYDVQLRLEPLMGEPVVGTRFRWRLNPNFSEVEVSELVTEKRRRIKLLNLPRDVALKARIYDVDIEFELSTATGIVHLLADGGDPGPGDGETWSFNVPGSPDWDELFYRTPLRSGDSRPNYLSEQDAKRIWKEGLRLNTARLVDVKTSTHDLVHWYLRQSKVPEVELTRKAIRNLAEGIRQGFGYELDAEEYAEVTPEDRWHTEGMGNLPSEEGLRAAEIDYAVLSERLGKLLEMPGRFEPTGELILFEAAVAELRSDIAELSAQRTERGLKDYPILVGLPPREFEEGHDIRTFNSIYSLVEYEGDDWVADPSGERLYRLEGGDLLFLDALVARIRSCELILIEPATEETFFQQEFDCQGWMHWTDTDNDAPRQVDVLSLDVHPRPGRIVQRYTSGSCRGFGDDEITSYSVNRYELGADLEVTKVGTDRHRHVTKASYAQLCLSTQ